MPLKKVTDYPLPILPLFPSEAKPYSKKTEESLNDYQNKEDNLKKLSMELSIDMIEESFISSCLHAERITLSHIKNNVSFVTQLFGLIRKFENIDLPQMFKNIFDRVNECIDTEEISGNRLYGILNMLLCFLRNSRSRSLISLSRDDGKHVILVLIRATSLIVKREVKDWPAWVSTSLVICYDLLSSVVSPSGFKDALLSSKDVQKHRAEPIEESKFEGHLIEEKSPDEVLSVSSRNEKAALSVEDQVRSLELVPRAMWVTVFETVDLMISRMVQVDASTCDIVTPKSCLQEIHQSVMLLLSHLVTDYAILQTSFDRGLMTRILQLPSLFSSKDNVSLLSNFTQSLLSTKDSVKADAKNAVISLFKDSNATGPSVDKLPLSKFFEKIRELDQTKTYPQQLASAILNLCDFYSYPSSDDSESTESFACLKADPSSVDGKSDESRSKEEYVQHTILLSLLSHAYRSVDSSSLMYTAADIVNLLNDVLTSKSYDSLSNWFGRLISMDASKILNPDSLRPILASGTGKSKGKTNFIDFIIANFFSTEASDEVKSNGVDPSLVSSSSKAYSASCSFIVILASRRGPLRRIALNALVRNIKLFSRPSADENGRLRTLNRLCAFIPSIFKSVKVDDDQQNPSSLDIMLHLISAGIADTLTEALAFIPLRHAQATDTINSILEPLEILSRPQYQNTIKEQLKKRNIGKSVVVQDELSSRLDEDFDPACDAHLPDSSQSSQHHSEGNPTNFTVYPDTEQPRVAETPMGLLRRYLDEVLHGENVAIDNADEDEDENEGDDEDVEEEEEDVREDVDGAEEDEGNEEDEEENDQIMQDHLVMMDDEDEDEDDLENDDERFDEFETMRLEPTFRSGVRRVVNMNDELGLAGYIGRPSSSFTTPPDRIRADPLQMLMNELTDERMAESPEEMIRQLMESESAGQVRLGHPLDPRSRMRPPRPNLSYPMPDTNQPANAFLNSPPASLHPLLSAADYGAVDVSSTTRPVTADRQHGLVDNFPLLGSHSSVLSYLPHHLNNSMSRSMASTAFGFDPFLSPFSRMLERRAGVDEATSDQSYSQTAPVSTLAPVPPIIRNAIQADCFIQEMNATISSMLIPLPSASQAAPADVESSVEDMPSLLPITAEDEITPSESNQESHDDQDGNVDVPPNTFLAVEGSRVPAVSPAPVSEDGQGEPPDSGDSVSFASETVPYVGDSLMMPNISGSAGNSLAGSNATEVRSFQDTVGESIISASILTIDAIRSHIDYDNVSMLSSIPTSESDEEDNGTIESNADNNRNQDSSTATPNLAEVDDHHPGGTESEAIPILETADVAEGPVDIHELEGDEVLRDFENRIADISIQERTDGDEAIPAALPSPSASATAVTDNSSGEGTAQASAADVVVPTTEPTLSCPAGYDRDVFYSLPEVMQQEIIEQYSQTNDQTRELIERAGYDFEMFSSLPESIQQEILDQARRDQQGSSATAAPATEDDNVSFLLSLTPDLRAEILLTADAAFLERLPVNLQAEAQQHRDQAARRIQDREISRGDRNPASRNDLNPHMVDDDDEYADGPIGGGPGILPYNNTFRNRSGRPYSPPTVDGYFRIPNDDVESLSLPLRLIAVITKVLCSTSKKINVSLLQQLILNLSKNSFIRDICLRLLVSLLSNDATMFKESLRKLDISSHASEAVYNLLMKSCDTLILNASKGCSFRRIGNPIIEKASEPLPSQSSKLANLSASSIDDMLLFGNEEDSLDSLPPSHSWTIPRHTLQSLLQLLSQLFASNASCIYDMIRPRVRNGGEIITTPTTGATSSGIDNAITNDSTDTPNVLDISGPSTSTAIVEESMSLDPSTPPSTNSLFEMLINLLSSRELIKNSSDMLSVTSLISKLSAPLDLIVKTQDKSRAELLELMQSRAESDTVKGLISVEVPTVIVSVEALTCLCDVLHSDFCTRRVFADVTAVISRLTVFQANQSVLVTLLGNVTETLTLQSITKLDGLVDILHQIYRIHNPVLKVTLGQGDTSPRPHAPLPAMAHSSLSSIATHELGGRQHEHLLRSIQTLSAISSKNKKDLNDLLPLPALSKLWTTLDEVFNQLRLYICKDEKESVEVIEDARRTSGGGARGTGGRAAGVAAGSVSPAALALTSISAQASIPSTASLSFVLTKLLPVVQSFFLVLANDILTPDSDDDNSTEPASATGPGAGAATAPVSVGIEGTGVPVEDSSSPGKTVEKLDVPVDVVTSKSLQVLGLRHRKSRAYIRMNINLYVDNNSTTSLNEEVHLQRVRSLQRTPSALNAPFSANSRAHRLQSFVSTHKNILNLLIKSQTGLLEKSLTALIRVTNLRPYLSFENKRKFFLQQLHLSRRGPFNGTINLRLRRESIFEDSYDQLRSRSSEEWQGRFQVDFHGEQGIDAGGLTREFYNVLSRGIFNPGYALFQATADGATFQPNPSSNVNSNHLSYFKFVGNIIGKAICDGQLMDAHFTRSFYKHVLGVPIDYIDIEATEPDYYKTLKQILDNPLESLMIDLTFSAESQRFGKTEIEDLIPNGRNIAVTDENKFDYVRLIAHHRMTSAIKAQIESFLDGFYELVPPELICVFSPTELELLICGLPDIDIDNLKLNTDYHGFRSSDESIVWFWESLATFSQEEKASFLQFVTGTSKVPLGGFGNLQGMRGMQRFSIHKAFGDHNQLPTAHTCFNQLDLPLYTSAEELRDKLLLAVKEGSEGFGFA